VSNRTVVGLRQGLENYGTATVVNDTFSNYTYTSIWNAPGGTLNLANTILAISCWNDGTLNASGVNLVEDGSCGGVPGNPRLASSLPVANGGPTKTIALLDGSPAIDAANATICAAAPVNNLDQRGVPRGADGKCDIGAYETQPAPFAFSGFQTPVSNTELNVVKAGQAVAIKFGLGGDQGLSIFRSGSPISVASSCLSLTLSLDTQETVTAGGSSLTYDAATDTYTYVWKTDKKWRGCREFQMDLTDSTTHTAYFSL
jgi:hypothetical protein